MSIGASQAQAAGSALTGVYGYKFGDSEILQLLDGARTFPMPDQFVANVPQE